MASFNLGPHPNMIQVLEKYNLKETVPLVDFIEALRKHEAGYTWRDLVPEGVGMIAWYLLYDAYKQDEEEAHGRKAQRINELAEGAEYTRITDD